MDSQPPIVSRVPFWKDLSIIRFPVNSSFRLSEILVETRKRKKKTRQRESSDRRAVPSQITSTRKIEGQWVANSGLLAKTNSKLSGFWGFVFGACPTVAYLSSIGLLAYYSTNIRGLSDFEIHILSSMRLFLLFDFEPFLTIPLSSGTMDFGCYSRHLSDSAHSVCQMSYLNLSQ